MSGDDSDGAGEGDASKGKGWHHGSETLPTLQGLVSRVRGSFRDVYGITHQGSARERNEDHFLVVDVDRTLTVRESSISERRVLPRTRATLLVVADGMGGEAGGEIASAIAVDTIADYVAHDVPWDIPDVDTEREVQEGFQRAALECQRRLREAVQRKHESRRAGTTLTAAFAIGKDLYIAHVGHSRAYLVRPGGDDDGGRCWRLTHDHTVARAAGEGRLTHVLANAISGTSEAPRVESLRAQLEVGDRVLLCSDGLTRYLDDDALAQVLLYAESARGAAEILTHKVLQTEARDDVTAVVAIVGE